MVQFGLSGKDLPHVADLLAAGAGKAMGSVEDLSNALKYVGPVAAGMGISIEETTGTLALFASARDLSASRRARRSAGCCSCADQPVEDLRRSDDG
jgi:TP901 family phage tail tape measure protein